MRKADDWFHLPKNHPVRVAAEKAHQDSRQTCQDAPGPTPERLQVTLPWPPSVNHYWRATATFRGQIRFYITSEGEDFRDAVAPLIPPAPWGGTPKFTGPLSIFIAAYPPDGRRRDIDNILKATLDALQHGGAYEDDSQIKSLHVEMVAPQPGKPGMVEVCIMPYKAKEV